MLSYKGYTGHVEFDDESGIFHGEVLDTRDVITFQGISVEDLSFCRAYKQRGPHKPPCRTGLL